MHVFLSGRRVGCWWTSCTVDFANAVSESNHDRKRIFDDVDVMNRAMYGDGDGDWEIV